MGHGDNGRCRASFVFTCHGNGIIEIHSRAPKLPKLPNLNPILCFWRFSGISPAPFLRYFAPGNANDGPMPLGLS
jgi:hypothetical protein